MAEQLSVFHQRLRLAAGRERQREIARRAEIPSSTFSRIWNGGEPDRRQLARIAAALNVTVDWLVKDATSMEVTLPDARVQMLSLRRNPKGGSRVLDESAPFTHLPADILDRLGIAKENARALIATGVAMRPTIDDGDVLLVDVSVKTITEGNIYAFTRGDDDLTVRRLRLSQNMLVIRADNQDLFPGEETVVPDRFELYGRVRWAGRTL